MDECNDFGELQPKMNSTEMLIDDFIADMKKVFPTLKDDWGMYIPEVKYLSPEPLVNYDNLALADFDNVHFVGDALSARGITVSGAQGTYVAENILKLNNGKRQQMAKAEAYQNA